MVDPKKQALPVWQQNTLKRDIRTRKSLEVALMHGKRGRDWGQVINLVTETYFFPINLITVVGIFVVFDLDIRRYAC